MLRPLFDRRYKASTRLSSWGLLFFLACATLLFFVIAMRSALGLALPLAMLFGAMIYGRQQASRQVLQSQRFLDIAHLRSLTPFEFERHVADCYQRLGYHVELTGGGGDQGIDVIASTAQMRLGIQCKKYAGSVGNDAVQQALAGKVFYACTHAAVIATSSFTAAARELAQRSGVQLTDGASYSDIVNKLGLSRGEAFRAWVPHGKPLANQLLVVAAAMGIFALHFMNLPIPPLESQSGQFQPQAIMPQYLYSNPSAVQPQAESSRGTLSEGAPATLYAGLVKTTRELRVLRTDANGCDGAGGLFIQFKDDGTSGCANVTKGETGVLESTAQVALIPVSTEHKVVKFALLYQLRNSSPRFIGILPGDGSGNLSVSIESGWIIERNGTHIKRSSLRSGRVVAL